MPKLLDLSYAGELGAANYIIGICDGKAVRFAADVFKAEAEAVISAFTALTDTPADYVDQAGKLAAVNSTETALEFVDPPSSLPTGGTVGQVLTKESATDGAAGWADVAAEFIELSDVPNSYYGKGDKFLKVNSAATGIEFGDAPADGGSSDTSSASKVFIYTHLEGGL